VTLLKDNQLSLAKDNLTKLNKLMPGHEKLKPLNKEFEEKLPAHVDALLNRGRQLYINGKIANAKNIWVKALTLDPENEQVKKNIERADRVLDRLNELKKQGTN
jgi:tetratricopeptide (TPR) repeat protein